MIQSPLILIADDESHIRSVVSSKLRSAGYRTVEVRDGEEALAAAASMRPSLLITDLQMPYMTGLELCQALADAPETRGIPILMLTARGYRLDAEALAATQVRHIMSKPFSAREVVMKVQELLGHGHTDADASTDRREAA